MFGISTGSCHFGFADVLSEEKEVSLLFSPPFIPLYLIRVIFGYLCGMWPETVPLL